MKIAHKNELTRKALGIARTEFMYYRSDRAHWKVVMVDGSDFNVTTALLGCESTVLRLAAEVLAKRGKPIEYPKGAA